MVRIFWNQKWEQKNMVRIVFRFQEIRIMLSDSKNTHLFLVPENTHHAFCFEKYAPYACFGLKKYAPCFWIPKNTLWKIRTMFLGSKNTHHVFGFKKYAPCFWIPKNTLFVLKNMHHVLASKNTHHVFWFKKYASIIYFGSKKKNTHNVLASKKKQYAPCLWVQKTRTMFSGSKNTHLFLIPQPRKKKHHVFWCEKIAPCRWVQKIRTSPRKKKRMIFWVQKLRVVGKL